MSEPEPAGEETLVASPLAAAGTAIVLYGIVRRSPLALFVGGIAVGAGLRLVRRD